MGSPRAIYWPLRAPSLVTRRRGDHLEGRSFVGPTRCETHPARIDHVPPPFDPRPHRVGVRKGWGKKVGNVLCRHWSVMTFGPRPQLRAIGIDCSAGDKMRLANPDTDTSLTTLTLTRSSKTINDRFNIKILHRFVPFHAYARVTEHAKKSSPRSRNETEPYHN